MLGRSAGLSDEKIRHLGDDPLSDVFSPEEAAIIRYSQASTQMKPITEAIYFELSRYFTTVQIMELWATVSLSNQVNRFHATFLTDLDQTTLEHLGASCPLPLPPSPARSSPGSRS